MRRGFVNRRGGGRNNGFLILMLMQLGQRIQRLERKPPVTLALMGFMVLIYLQPSLAPSIRETCLSPSNADIFRLIGSAFLHASDMHLYYNMSSFLWKGVQIELAAGSKIFAAMVTILLLMSHTLFVIIGNIAGDALPFGGAAGCAVGFSAVLFALKVVLNDGSETHSSIFGISVPSKYAAWLELIVASVISPSASFLGHLCGILAGYIWVRGGVGRKIGELVMSGGNAQAWHDPIGFMRRTSPESNGGFFGGLGNMFNTLFNGDQTVPQQQQHQRQPAGQYQNGVGGGNIFGSLNNMFFGGDPVVPQHQHHSRGTYGRGTTGGANDDDANMRRAMEQSRREYEQSQQREPTSAPPTVSQAEELRRRRIARFN
jgi:membrane associated rhomboid family serine protease